MFRARRRSTRPQRLVPALFPPNPGLSSGATAWDLPQPVGAPAPEAPAALGCCGDAGSPASGRGSACSCRVPPHPGTLGPRLVVVPPAPGRLRRGRPGDASDERTEAEGTFAGECADGADNDQDGAFDCDDPDCAGAPEARTEATARTGATAQTGATARTVLVCARGRRRRWDPGRGRLRSTTTPARPPATRIRSVTASSGATTASPCGVQTRPCMCRGPGQRCALRPRAAAPGPRAPGRRVLRGGAGLHQRPDGPVASPVERSAFNRDIGSWDVTGDERCMDVRLRGGV